MKWFFCRIVWCFKQWRKIVYVILNHCNIKDCIPFPFQCISFSFLKAWICFKKSLGCWYSKIMLTKYQLEPDLGSLLTSSRIWKQTVFVLCQKYSVWMSSTADLTSKNTSEISHCELSIGFSLSWESMHFRHLASEYDLFDPLNYVWERVKKKKKNSALRIGFQGNSQAIIQVNVTGAREGVVPQVGGHRRRRRREGISILIP